MKVALLCAAALLARAAEVPEGPAGHPRVYATAADVVAIRAKIATGEFRSAWEQVRAATGAPRRGYFCSAFVYLVEGGRETGRRAVGAPSQPLLLPPTPARSACPSTSRPSSTTGATPC